MSFLFHKSEHSGVEHARRSVLNRPDNGPHWPKIRLSDDLPAVADIVDNTGGVERRQRLRVLRVPNVRRDRRR